MIHAKDLRKVTEPINNIKRDEILLRIEERIKVAASDGYFELVINKENKAGWDEAIEYLLLKYGYDVRIVASAVVITWKK